MKICEKIRVPNTIYYVEKLLNTEGSNPKYFSSYGSFRNDVTSTWENSNPSFVTLFSNFPLQNPLMLRLLTPLEHDVISE